MTLQTLSLLIVLAGVIIAVIGRRIFWLTVALAGFALGYVLTQLIVTDVNPTLGFAIGLVFGVVFAILAIKGVPVIVSGVGAVLAGLVLVALVDVVTDQAWVLWAAFAVGAVVGWLVVSAGFQPAVIVLTAFAGGALVMRALQVGYADLASWIPYVAGAVTLLLGLIVQFQSRGREQVDSVPS